MPNLNYTRSRAKEYKTLHDLEAKGYFAIRTAGSHGIADVIGIKPSAKKCADPNHFRVKFIQIKVSKNGSKKNPFKNILKAVDSIIGMINVEFHHYTIHERQNSVEAVRLKTPRTKRKA